MQEMRLALSGV